MQPHTTGRLYRRPESSVYWMEIRQPGQKKLRRSTKATKIGEAQRALETEISRLSGLTWQAAVVNFFEAKSLAQKTLAGYSSSARSLDQFLKDRSLSEIDATLLKKIVRERRSTVSDTSVRRDLAFISTVISSAMETMDDAPEVNPVVHFSKKHLKEKSRTRWLKPHEYQRILGACENRVQKKLVEAFCLTGMRHTEMTLLRKSMIDFNRSEIILPAEIVKRDHERVIPMCVQLCLSLQELCSETPGDLVFCYMNARSREWTPYQSFKSTWARIQERAKLDDVRIHDLRHTFASWYVQNGGGLLTLRDILGHRSLQMVQRYAHLDTAAHHREIKEVFGHSFDTEKNNR